MDCELIFDNKTNKNIFCHNYSCPKCISVTMKEMWKQPLSGKV